MNRPRHRTSLSRLIGVAVLALLLGQWTVLLHSIEHAHAHKHAHAHEYAEITAEANADHDWGHEAGTPTCQLLDQLLTGQAPSPERLAVDYLRPADVRVAAPAPSTAPGPAWRAYQPRGPPPL